MITLNFLFKEKDLPVHLSEFCIMDYTSSDSIVAIAIIFLKNQTRPIKKLAEISKIWKR